MRNSKIYFNVETERAGDKSFGCDDYADIKILVGTSKSHSFEIGTVAVKCYQKEEQNEYFLTVDGVPVKKVTFDKFTKEFKLEGAK